MCQSWCEVLSLYLRFVLDQSAGTMRFSIARTTFQSYARRFLVVVAFDNSV